MNASEERRPRTPVADLQPAGLRSLRFRAGAEVDVVDISASGALIETERYVGPGTSVEMMMGLPEGVVPVRAWVAHAQVCRLAHGRRPCYRVGLRFAGLPADWVPARRGKDYTTRRPAGAAGT